MKILSSFFAIVLIFSTLGAFADSNNELVKAYPGASNTKLIQYTDIKSAKVKNAFQEVDIAFEMGDGYYSTIKSAYYMVFTQEGKLAGFMQAALLSYTQDPDIYLVAAFITTGGVRLGQLHEINSYINIEDESLKELPVELQP